MSQLDLARLQFAMTSIYHFLFVPVTIGLALPHRAAADLLVPHRARGLPAADPVLRDAAGHQRRGRRRHRPGAGVPVRHGLVGVLAHGRRRVRRPAGDGGARRVLPRVDLPRPVGVRVGDRCRAGCTSPPSGPSHSAGRCPRRSSWPRTRGCSTRSATPPTRRPAGRSWTTSGPCMTNPVFLRGYVHVLLASLTTASAVMLAVAAWQLRRGAAPDVFRPAARLALAVLVPAALLGHARRQRAGRDRGDVPADEDRRLRGAVDDLPAVLVLALPDRRRATATTRPTKIIQVPHLLSLLATNSWNGQVLGLNQVQAQYTSDSTARGTTCRTSSSSTGRCG